MKKTGPSVGERYACAVLKPRATKEGNSLLSIAPIPLSHQLPVEELEEVFFPKPQGCLILIFGIRATNKKRYGLSLEILLGEKRWEWIEEMAEKKGNDKDIYCHGR